MSSNMSRFSPYRVLALLLVVLAIAAPWPASTAISQAQDDGQPGIGLRLVADGLVAPVDLEDDGAGRLFIVDRPGVIYAVDGMGGSVGEPFLDLRDRIVSLDPGYDERGLLAMALHPDFATNRRFFVYYSAPPRAETPPGYTHVNILSEFTVSADGATVDPASERVVFALDHPQPNHNGGDITFGPDGFLYVPLGDGGGGNDEGLGHTPGIGNGQDRTNLFGSLLRIDVNVGEPYGVPADNPFVTDTAAAPEIFAYGLRNPWRISFDSSGNLYLSDAGQELYEEVNLVTAGGNYGWRIKEGTHCFDPNMAAVPPEDCPDTGPNGEPLIDPVIEFDHTVGIVVVGGAVYEGTALPDLAGQLIFGVWTEGHEEANGRLFAAQPSGAGLWSYREIVFDTGAEEEAAQVTGEGEMQAETGEAPAEGEAAEALSEGGEPSGDGDGEGAGGADYKIAPADIAPHPGQEEGEEEEEEVTGLYILAVEADSAGEIYILTTQAEGLTGTTGRVYALVGNGVEIPAVEEPTASDAPGAAAPNPSLMVENQQLAADGTVTIASVVSPGAGWIMIHADDRGYYGAPIGSVAVPAGQSTSVVVPIDTNSATMTLHAMLHADAGVPGTLEFPGPDAPVTGAHGRVLNVPFLLLPDDPAAPLTVSVALDEFYAMMPPTLPAGMVTFSVTNHGAHPHNLEIESDDFELLLFETDLQPGETRTATANIAPGEYEVYCPVGDHADFGMRYHVPFVVVDISAVQPAAATPTAAVELQPTVTPDPNAVAEPTATLDPAVEATPTPTPEGEVEGPLAIEDQQITPDGTVVASHVMVDAPAWLAIHADSSGQPGMVIGWTLVEPGTTFDVAVPIQGENVTGLLHAMLHVDAGELGTYEFPGPDTPLLDENGQVIQLPFTVTVAE